MIEVFKALAHRHNSDERIRELEAENAKLREKLEAEQDWLDCKCERAKELVVAYAKSRADKTGDSTYLDDVLAELNIPAIELERKYGWTKRTV
ncbi:hypothetical protein [Photorhabdus bodei]|uniref:Uncharacterized protein n=1 Tax=Photorhabdus bodei TaxID=2029681 RepID=A0AAW6BMV3_9GAMM|nr:hypothetical protein [Photorhabdus bodei]MCC8466670.1 hypothetical protein [Photorhabdus bodei]MDB6374483.1 hypothetical protein [Photorhabdus bodei]